VLGSVEMVTVCGVDHPLAAQVRDCQRWRSIASC
jgi:hypothetical protein